MGLLEKILPKPRAVKQGLHYFKTLTAYQPVFNSWNGIIYESELVRGAIDALARNTAKLDISIAGAARPTLQSKLRQAPNSFQTWAQFLYQLRTIYEVDTTAFIVPIFDKYGDVTGIYPICPSRTVVMESKDGTMYLHYTFKNGTKAAIEYNLCGTICKFQYDKEFYGSGNRALSKTMDLIHLQNQGIAEGIKNSATFRFMAQYNNFLSEDDLEKERTRFNEHNLAGEGGVLLFPNTYSNISQIDSKPFVINAAQQQLIQNNIYNYFGVNEDVLQNKAVGDKWSAFYEGAIEGFAIQLAEVLNKMLFTSRERASGSGVVISANRLQYMTNADKLNVSAQMIDRGIMSRNEIRQIWQLPPIEGGDDFIIRGEYYNANDKLEEVNADESSDSTIE